MKKQRRVNGFTLIEVLIVLVILSIIIAIAVPSVIKVIEKSKKEICYVNQLEIERMYEQFLELEGLDHSGEQFKQFMLSNNYSADHGEYSYIEGKVRCSIHAENESQEDKEEESVPFF